MSTNVAALFGGPSPLEPVPEVVRELERLLSEARDGTLRGIAFAVSTVDAGGSIGTGWEMAEDQKWALCAALMTLSARFGIALAGVNNYSDMQGAS